jgi:hypothetical protein
MSERRYSPKEIQRMEEREEQFARLHSQYHSLVRRYNKLYENNRRLENKIRETIVIGEEFDATGLLQLLRMIPKEPRATLRELQKSILRRNKKV